MKLWSEIVRKEAINILCKISKTLRRCAGTIVNRQGKNISLRSEFKFPSYRFYLSFFYFFDVDKTNTSWILVRCISLPPLLKLLTEIWNQNYHDFCLNLTEDHTFYSVIIVERLRPTLPYALRSLMFDSPISHIELI